MNLSTTTPTELVDRIAEDPAGVDLAGEERTVLLERHGHTVAWTGRGRDHAIEWRIDGTHLRGWFGAFIRGKRATIEPHIARILARHDVVLAVLERRDPTVAVTKARALGVTPLTIDTDIRQATEAAAR